MTIKQQNYFLESDEEEESNNENIITFQDQREYDAWVRNNFSR